MGGKTVAIWFKPEGKPAHVLGRYGEDRAVREHDALERALGTGLSGDRWHKDKLWIGRRGDEPDYRER